MAQNSKNLFSHSTGSLKPTVQVSPGPHAPKTLGWVAPPPASRGELSVCPAGGSSGPFRRRLLDHAVTWHPPLTNLCLLGTHRTREDFVLTNYVRDAPICKMQYWGGRTSTCLFRAHNLTHNVYLGIRCILTSSCQLFSSSRYYFSLRQAQVYFRILMLNKKSHIYFWSQFSRITQSYLHS